MINYASNIIAFDYLLNTHIKPIQKENEKLKKQIGQLKTTPQNDSLKNFNALANQILNTDIKVTDGPSKEIFATKKDLCGNNIALKNELNDEMTKGFKLNKYVDNN